MVILAFGSKGMKPASQRGLSRIFAIVLTIALVIFPMSSVFSAVSSKPAVKSIRYGINAGKTRVVIDLAAKTDFRAFLLDNPNRVVIDMPALQWRVPRSGKFSDDTLKGYRSGELDGGLSRLIFDLRQPVVVKNAFILPRDGFSEDRLVLDLAPVSQNVFSAATAEVFGNKNLKGTGAASATSGYRAIENNLVQAASPGTVAMPARKPGTLGPPEKFTIIVDAGHGGVDPGAVVGHVREKDITLATARALKTALES